MKKSKTRIFVDKLISLNLMIYIKSKKHHFLKNVIRVKINDKVNIFDGISGEWQTTVISVNRDNTILRVIENICELKQPIDLWLIFAPIKSHRMSLSIQKATELGVSKIIPCLTEFTNIRSLNRKNLFDNAVEASEQSGRLDVPKIEKEVELKSLLLEWPKDRKLIFCDEKTHSGNSIIETSLAFKNSNSKWAVLIGPEGGFSESEHKLIVKSRNVMPVSLGKRLLRSDTAITVSLYCIQELLAK